MNKKTRFGMNLSPAQYVSLMFSRTSENGYLYLPGWYHDCVDDSDLVYECAISWNRTDCEQTIGEIEALLSGIERIDALSERFGRGASGDREILEREGLLSIYDTYVRPFEADERFDPEQLRDIREREYWEQENKRIAKEIAFGRKVCEADRKCFAEHMLDEVSEEELQLLDAYRDALQKEAQERIGDGPCALEVMERIASIRNLVRERRRKRSRDPESEAIGRLDEIIHVQSVLLSAVFVIHRFGKRRQKVDRGHELRENTILQMVLEEEDGIDTGLYEPKKANSRKALAPLFVYLILRGHSSPARHLRQREILAYLEDRPFEIKMERKALSRIIHGLADSQIGIRFWKNDGAWYDAAGDLIASKL